MRRTFSYQSITAVLMAVLFVNVFVFASPQNWSERYAGFNIPAFTFPGGDARNIQVHAYCRANAKTVEAFESCYATADIVKSRYPDATVVPYNYPGLWSEAYQRIGDFSEGFFLGFWRLNALVLVGTLLVLSLRMNAALFPLLIFSPVTILTVERGNIDAICFFLTFSSLVLMPKRFGPHGVLIGIASAAKIFPLLALPVLFLRQFRPYRRRALIGIALALPLLVMTLSDLPRILLSTIKGFSYAYGFLSLWELPALAGQAAVIVGLLVIYAITAMSCVYVILRTELARDMAGQLTTLSTEKTLILGASMLVFLLTFVLFNNWAYRLIFLMPALLVLSQCTGRLPALICGIGIVVLWIPLVPSGWGLLNLACYVLAPLIAVVVILLFASPFRNVSHIAPRL